MNTTDAQNIAQKLEEQKEQIIAQIANLKKSDPFENSDHAIDNAAIDTDIREQEGHDLIEAETETLQERLQDIDEALVRIKEGRYGYCAKCGKEIPQARLSLIPEAKFCVDCESKSKI